MVRAAPVGGFLNLAPSAGHPESPALASSLKPAQSRTATPEMPLTAQKLTKSWMSWIGLLSRLPVVSFVGLLGGLLRFAKLLGAAPFVAVFV